MESIVQAPITALEAQIALPARLQLCLMPPKRLLLARLPLFEACLAWFAFRLAHVATLPENRWETLFNAKRFLCQVISGLLDELKFMREERCLLAQRYDSDVKGLHSEIDRLRHSLQRLGAPQDLHNTFALLATDDAGLQDPLARQLHEQTHQSLHDQKMSKLHIESSLPAFPYAPHAIQAYNIAQQYTSRDSQELPADLLPIPNEKHGDTRLIHEQNSILGSSRLSQTRHTPSSHPLYSSQPHTPASSTSGNLARSIWSNDAGYMDIAAASFSNTAAASFDTSYTGSDDLTYCSSGPTNAVDSLNPIFSGTGSGGTKFKSADAGNYEKSFTGAGGSSAGSTVIGESRIRGIWSSASSNCSSPMDAAFSVGETLVDSSFVPPSNVPVKRSISGRTDVPGVLGHGPNYSPTNFQVSLTRSILTPFTSTSWKRL